MVKWFIYCIILYIFFITLYFVGCGSDDQKPIHSNPYFREAGVAYQNGDFDKAFTEYKLFLNSDDKENESLIPYADLQLARISFSRGNYKEAITYAQNVKSSDLFYKAYWQKEETLFDHTMKGMFTKKETDKTNSFGYSLKNNALTIIGSSYLKKGEYDNAIRNFKEINPESESLYYLALSYGLKGDITKARMYYQLNSEKGSVGVLESKQWLVGNPK
ncbi:MAG: tetratricopeptide repeat protein [Ignavibacteriaceae bacterium]|nr:tetratricopeptide repeat protein [Ignavibacteriaceae bacterium]